MAHGIFVGIGNKARRAIKLLVGVKDKARRITKVYVGVNDVAQLCYEAIKVTVSYVTSLTASYTTKEIWFGDKYSLPTITPSNSSREDFWFKPDATAKNDSKKKYIDYPWCAYADANSSVYKSYGYSQDLLAKHWNETGRAAGYSKGDVASQLCLTEENHTLQHVYRPKTITLTTSETEDSNNRSFVDVQDSKGNLLKAIDNSCTYNIYPGMTLVFHARYHSGLGSDDGGNHACKVTVDGEVLGYRGASYWKVPDNIKAIKVTLTIDDHRSPLFAQSWIVTATTTKI